MPKIEKSCMYYVLHTYYVPYLSVAYLASVLLVDIWKLSELLLVGVEPHLLTHDSFAFFGPTQLTYNLLTEIYVKLLNSSCYTWGVKKVYCRFECSSTDCASFSSPSSNRIKMQGKISHWPNKCYYRKKLLPPFHLTCPIKICAPQALIGAS